MAYPNPFHRVHSDNKGNIYHHDPLLPGQNPIVPYNDAERDRPVGPQYPFISLWKQQLIAIFSGSVSLVLGVLGIAAYFRRGPLYDLFIPADRFQGHIINSSNIGALVGGIATGLAALAQIVAAGMSRAWLRRTAVKGHGVTIKQWRTLSAGGSLNNARRTPWMASGLTLAFVLAIGISSSSLSGVAIPSSRLHNVTTEYGPIIPFRGNGGIGQFVNCVSLAEDQTCSSWLDIPNIVNAFGLGVYAGGTISYQLSGGRILSPDAGFLAGVDTGSLSNRPVNPIDYAFAPTPVSAYSTTCRLLDTASTALGRYTYYSDCEQAYQYYGNTSIGVGEYIYGTTCFGADNQTYIVELGMGGAIFGYDVAGSDHSYAVQCDVTGNEGMGNSTYYYGIATYLQADVSSGFEPLASLDMISLGTAFVAALISEVGLNGKLGIMGTALASTFQSDGTVNLTAIANGLSNSWAAAATAGYTLQIGGGPLLANGSVEYHYPNTIDSLPVSWVQDGFGWSHYPRVLAWSIVCVLVGLVWLAAAVYMIGGGTRYNPTDWYQTLNTSAGSNLAQWAGTCTGANLNSTDVNNCLLWYGELGPTHVGFAAEPVPPVEPKKKYGVPQPVMS